MLRPETQDLASFVDGVDNIVTTQKQIAENYFADGSVALACPPLKALLHIMRDGQYEGKDINDPCPSRPVHPRIALGKANGIGSVWRPSKRWTCASGSAISITCASF